MFRCQLLSYTFFEHLELAAHADWPNTQKVTSFALSLPSLTVFREVPVLSAATKESLEGMWRHRSGCSSIGKMFVSPSTGSLTCRTEKYILDRAAADMLRFELWGVLPCLFLTGGYSAIPLTCPLNHNDHGQKQVEETLKACKNVPHYVAVHLPFVTLLTDQQVLRVIFVSKLRE